MKYFIVFLALTGGHFVFSGYISSYGLGTECLYDEDCITRNSFCKGNKICACKIGYQYDPGSDICFPKEIDLKCNEDYDCSALKNAKCTFGKCQCQTDYVTSKDKASCLPSMRLTSSCTEDSQCSSVMNRSYCGPMRRCVCERGLHQDPYRMQCVEEAKLHMWCQKDEDCYRIPDSTGKVKCKSSGGSLMLYTCECADGYEERNDICYAVGSSHAVLPVPIIIAFVLVKSLRQLIMETL